MAWGCKKWRNKKDFELDYAWSWFEKMLKLFEAVQTEKTNWSTPAGLTVLEAVNKIWRAWNIWVFAASMFLEMVPDINKRIYRRQRAGDFRIYTSDYTIRLFGNWFRPESTLYIQFWIDRKFWGWSFKI